MLQARKCPLRAAKVGNREMLCGKSHNVLGTLPSYILVRNLKLQQPITMMYGKQASGTGAYLLFVQYVVVNHSVPTTFLLLAINVVIVYHYSLIPLMLIDYSN